MGRCLYQLPNTVFSSATSALFLEFSQFCCSSECPVETVVVFVLDVPHCFVGQKLFWSSQRFSYFPPASGWCRSSETLASWSTCVPPASGCCRSSEILASWPSVFHQPLDVAVSPKQWPLGPLVFHRPLVVVVPPEQWTLGPLVFYQPLDVAIPPKQWPLQSLALHCRLGGPYLQKHSLQSLLVYTLCHGFWNHIGKLLQAPICSFFYIRVETVRSLLPKAVRRLQSWSGPLCALAYLQCLVRI